MVNCECFKHSSFTQYNECLKTFHCVCDPVILIGVTNLSERDIQPSF